jgi:hypothetical protein
MRQQPSFFDDTEARLVYIARKLKDALVMETLLTEAGFDYGVEADRYKGGVIFQAERVGAFFYVRPEAEAAVREFLDQHGFKPAPPEISSL